MQVLIILDDHVKSDLLKNKFRNYFKIQQESKYFQILAFAYCGRFIETPSYRRDTIKPLPSKLLENREFIKVMLKSHGIMMQYLIEDFRHDKELALIAINQNAKSYSYIGENLKSDFEIILKTFNAKSPSLDATIEILTQWPDFAYSDALLNVIGQGERILKFAYASLLENKEFILKAVKLNGNAITYAPKNLANDEEVAFAAVMSNPAVIPSLYKNNESFVRKYVEKSRYPSILNYVDMNLRKNRNIVLETVKKNPSQLRYAKREIRRYDKEIVMCALQKSGRLLEYVEIPLLADREIVETAIQNFPLALKYADKLRDDREIVLMAITKNRHALIHASERLQKELQHIYDDSEIESEINNKSTLEYWSKKFLVGGDRNDVLEAIKYGIDPFSLNYQLIPEIKSDAEIMLELIKKDEKLIQLVGNSLDLNFSFVRKCIRNNRKCLLHIRDHILLEREFLLNACVFYSIQDFENFTIFK